MLHLGFQIEDGVGVVDAHDRCGAILNFLTELVKL
jgi:hypothetical protein